MVKNGLTSWAEKSQCALKNGHNALIIKCFVGNFRSVAQQETDCFQIGSRSNGTPLKSEKRQYQVSSSWKQNYHSASKLFTSWRYQNGVQNVMFRNTDVSVQDCPEGGFES